MTENNNRKGRNWRATYLTIKAFNEWKDNDFFHMKVKVGIAFWEVQVILAIILIGIGAIIVRSLVG